MTDIVQYISTLFAVVIGGITTYLGAAVMERSRWKRGRSSRWDQRRLEAYVDFARAVKEESRVAMRIAAGRNAGPKTDPLPLEEGRESYAIAEHNRSMLFEAVLLLGDSPSIAAGRAWYQSVWDGYQLVSKRTPPIATEFTDLYKSSDIARMRFYESARASLEIRGQKASGPVSPDTGRDKY